VESKLVKTDKLYQQGIFHLLLFRVTIFLKVARTGIVVNTRNWFIENLIKASGNSKRNKTEKSF
jgi:hypothetical protein